MIFLYSLQHFFFDRYCLRFLQFDFIRFKQFYLFGIFVLEWSIDLLLHKVFLLKAWNTSWWSYVVLQFGTIALLWPKFLEDRWVGLCMMFMFLDESSQSVSFLRKGNKFSLNSLAKLSFGFKYELHRCMMFLFFLLPFHKLFYFPIVWMIS